MYILYGLSYQISEKLSTLKEAFYIQIHTKIDTHNSQPLKNHQKEIYLFLNIQYVLQSTVCRPSV